MAKGEHMQIFKVDGNLYCYRCGDSFPLQSFLPAPVDQVADLLKGFSARHDDCEQSDRGRDLDVAHEAQWAAMQQAAGTACASTSVGA